MEKKTIGILFGGNSSEYEVSLQSAGAVIKHFPYHKYELYMIGITREGKWYHYQGEIDKIINDTWYLEKNTSICVCLNPKCQAIMEISANRIKYCHLDAVFPILHGKNGEDGTIQGLMQLANIPVIGCGILSSALCMDKQRAHELIKNQGIKVANAIVVKNTSNYDKELNRLQFPLFVKPVKAGSSYGISKVLDKQHLEQAINYAFKYDDEVIIEEALLAREVGCAIIGNDILEVGLIDEIELSQGFFDYHEKYTLKTSKIHLPARIDELMVKKIKDTAMLIYRILGCQGFARVDMFLTDKGEIYFNEVNTIPGFTTHSRFPQMMNGIGYDFFKLIDRIIGIGLQGKYDSTTDSLKNTNSHKL